MAETACTLGRERFCAPLGTCPHSAFRLLLHLQTVAHGAAGCPLQGLGDEGPTQFNRHGDGDNNSKTTVIQYLGEFQRWT